MSKCRNYRNSSVKAAALFVLMSFIMAMVCGCSLKSDEEMIEDRMNSFLRAYNSGDMQQVLESLDAQTKSKYQSVMNLGNAVIGLTGFGISISDLFGLGVGLSGGTVLELEDMEIKIVSDAKAYVTATMNYQGIQESYSQSIKFTLVKEYDDWFIRE